MLRVALLTLLVTLLPATSAFKANAGAPRKNAVAASLRPRVSPAPQASNILDDAWKRFVLIRAEDQDCGDGWWGRRTPGTARTMVISSVICSFFAVPALLKNPLIFTRLLELASLDRVGVTPMEFYEKTGSFF
jgi:hypothetical protein